MLESAALYWALLQAGAGMANTRVKICGIASVVDAQQAVDAGADAIGLVFYPDSPRAVTAERAADIALAVGPYVSVVGLFVNARVEVIEATLARVPLHVLQFHGDEEASFCQQFQRPWYKAIRMESALDPKVETTRFPGACGLLFDTWSRYKYGGTGDTFDWQRVPQSQRPMVLAGGLNPDNIAEAVAAVRPYAVDVSSGVELAPGKKCPHRVREFIDRAKAIDL